MRWVSGINAQVWRQSAWSNRLQSLILLTLMGGFLALLGWLFWGESGLFVLLAVGFTAVLFNPALSTKVVMRMYGARPIGQQEAPVLWDILAKLSAASGLAATPQPFYMPSGILTAFAVGAPERSAIALTDGLLQRLDLRELTGVLAHEVSHIRSNDLWVMGLADMFSRATSMLSLLGQLLLLFSLPLIFFSHVTLNWGAILLLIFAPNISMLAQLALSRTREYDADLNAARLTGDPEGLALALAKIERVQGGWLERILLPGRRMPEPSLLRTHPQTEERIERLMMLKPHWPMERSPFARLYPQVVRQPLGRPVAHSPRWHITGLWH